MPLTPLPPSNTKRYTLVYTVGGQSHHMMARAGAGATDTDAVNNFTAIFAALESAFYSDVSGLGILKQEQGSDVANPISGWTVMNGTSGSPITPQIKPRAWAFSGRSATGRKSRVYVYGTVVAPGDTWEQDPLTDARFQGFQGLLNSQSDFWLAIDGTKPSWYFRATADFNDHYVREARQ